MSEGGLQKDLDVALSAIEGVEAKALAWGFVDGSFSTDELEEIVAEALGPDASPDHIAHVLDALSERRLIRTWREHRERKYRTRFAELVRLLVRNRQWFPSKTWRVALPLVADYRIDIRPRRYPKRIISRDACWTAFVKVNRLTDLQKRIWELLLPPEAFLAKFQLDSCLRLLSKGNESGTIVTAGTGSGKTLAFYLPTLISLVEEVGGLGKYVKALAIYPRQELLKDQLTEALRLVSKISAELTKAGKRPLSIGAFYGGTPRNSSEEELTRQGWKRRPGGAFVCPLVRCPQCGGDMSWLAEMRKKGIESLVCSVASCSTVTESKVLALTRDTISINPPDILFTTTEMLNQRLSDVRMRHLFGIGKQIGQRPRFLLLDEVHTYEGLSGAQTGVLLRRWRHLVGSPVFRVGLSATLKDAEQFFATLTGLRADQVAEITPLPEDIEEEGAEYQLIVRSDPASQASTLSASIQSLMLVGRMLEPRSDAVTNGRFGSRLFAFTDDLDATNRLFDNLRDAEAYDRFGRPDATRRPLAALRETGAADEVAREAHGQRWAMAEEIRGSLDTRLSVTRTSSRDQGVDMSSEVVVATSSLEVGFNDPDVGAVLQHKAPRGVASFLQRKGRAGRRRGMRPITLTVLSDYGRDRVAFQNYERLFDPTVPRQLLPVRNSYILRMQAVFALLDWVAVKAANSGAQGWSWDVLSAPAKKSSGGEFLKVARTVLQALVQLDPLAVAEFGAHLKGALQIDDSTLKLILWESPRAVLTEAIPTLARRLFRNWKLSAAPGLDFHVPYHPLPEFIPRALFSELTLPEIQIDLPPSRIGQERTRESMQVLQAMQQFVPGRVRRRFADDYGGLAHWVALDDSQPTNIIRIEAYAPEREFVDSYVGMYGSCACSVAVYRPWIIPVDLAKESEVLPTSNGRWIWQTSLEYRGASVDIDAPSTSEWASIIPTVQFYLSRFGGAISVARFASEGISDIRRRDRSSLIRFQLRDQADTPVAVGFAYEADGFSIDLNLPSALNLSLAPLQSDTRRWARTMMLRDAIRRAPSLPEEVNEFQREWLFDLVLLASVLESEKRNIPMHEAAKNAITSDEGRLLKDALPMLVDEPAGEDGEETSRLSDDLNRILSQSYIRDALAAVVTSAMNVTDPQWREWLHDRLHDTLAESVLQACVVAAPENTALDGLVVEAGRGSAGERRISVIESTMGGGGTLEILAHSFALEPQTLFRAIEAALAPSDLEMAALSLESVVELTQTNSTISECLSELRGAGHYKIRSDARRRLVSAISDAGVSVDRALSVALATRLVRPGASPDTDNITHEILTARTAIARRADYGLPLRIAAPLVATLDIALRMRLEGVSAGSNAIDVAALMMWPEAGEIRGRSLENYNPFRDAKLADAAIVRDLLLSHSAEIVVDLSDPKWLQQCRDGLVKKGRVKLVTAYGKSADIRSAIVSLISEPISAGYLQFFATIESLSRSSDGKLGADVVLREQV